VRRPVPYLWVFERVDVDGTAVCVLYQPVDPATPLQSNPDELSAAIERSSLLPLASTARIHRIGNSA